jgi:hypothetical protein
VQIDAAVVLLRQRAEVHGSPPCSPAGVLSTERAPCGEGACMRIKGMKQTRSPHG